MPSILQITRLDYTDIAETVFWGGTAIAPVSATEFRTIAGGYTLVFRGTGLTYDAQNRLTGGVIDEYRLFFVTALGQRQDLVVTSNFDLLTAAEAQAAFDAFAAGDTGGAVDRVTASWTAEYFSHTNQSGGPLYGYGGGDGLSGGAGDDIVFGRGGDDGIILGSGDDAGIGGVGNDWLYGGTGRDSLFGGTGNDQLRGEDGNDWLSGDAGTDVLYGGKGNDRMAGGAGDDALLGDRGNDRAWGGAGDDRIDGDQGDDRLHGGRGDDRLDGGDHDDHLRGGAGNDELAGGIGDDILGGDAGRDVLNGGNGADILDGGRGPDQLKGGAGNDLLRGGAGNDSLDGGAEDDTLDTAGGGNDLLRGGLGADTFVIRSSAGDRVTIVDFADGVDAISLTAFGFADEAAALAAAMETAAGHVVFDLGGGQSLRVLNTTEAELAGDLLV